MFQIKVCGIKTEADVEAVVTAGGDAVGINLYRSSPRFLALDVAAPILAQVPSNVAKIGLFVNAHPMSVCWAFDEAKLDYIQLHGDEPPEYLPELGGRPVIRALRVGAEGLDSVERYLADCRALGCMPNAILLDAHVCGQYGGTGTKLNWDMLAQHNRTEWPEMILAGGLRPDNVAEAISTVRPTAVDTASGVESALGQKSPDLIAAFIAAARAAFAR